MTAATPELVAHIAAIVARTEAWIAEDPENRWATVPMPAERWAEQGITTVEQYRHSSAVDTYSDMYKDRFGIRPRMVWADFTADQIEGMIDDLPEPDVFGGEDDPYEDYDLSWDAWVKEVDLRTPQEEREDELYAIQDALMA
jgi:hypothetical protein